MMSNLPSYYAWQPSLESGGDIVSILLTRGAKRHGPGGGRDFFEAVLVAAGIDAILTAWGVEPFLTAYFAKDEWQECWDARLLLSQKINATAAREIEGHPIFALPEGEIASDTSLPLRVLADFASWAKAAKCRDALRRRAAEAKWDDIHYERYAIRDIGLRQKQLLIDVTTVERVRVSEAIPAANEVMAICEESGGRINRPPSGERRA